MKATDDYRILAQPGNIGFYNSCEITQLFLHDKNSKTNTNLFILAVKVQVAKNSDLYGCVPGAGVWLKFGTCMVIYYKSQQKGFNFKYQDRYSVFIMPFASFTPEVEFTVQG